MKKEIELRPDLGVVYISHQECWRVHPIPGETPKLHIDRTY